MTERLMRSGSWSWTIEHDQHSWSLGCFDLLGLDKNDDAPSYGRLVRSVHPADRPKMPRVADLLRGEPIPPQVVQVIRRDGTTRIVSAAFESRLAQDGRPQCACGVLVDVTDREWLARSRMDAIRRRRRLDAHAGVLRFTMRRDRSFDFVPEAADMLARDLQDINADPFAVVCPDESMAVHALISHHQTTGASLFREIALDRPKRPAGSALLVMVPAICDRGEPDTWDGLLQLQGIHDDAGGSVDDVIEAMLEGSDLLAARALLGWSRQDMARISRLSTSTIRRLEDGEWKNSGRSLTRAVHSLRLGGVRFQLTFDRSVAISRRLERPGSNAS